MRRGEKIVLSLDLKRVRAMMLSDVCLSDVCRVHPVGGRRVRPAGWIARIG